MINSTDLRRSPELTTKIPNSVKLSNSQKKIFNLTKNNYFLDERINWKHCAALGRFSSMSLKFII